MNEIKPLNKTICKQVDERLYKLFNMDKQELYNRIFNKEYDNSLIKELFTNFHN